MDSFNCSELIRKLSEELKNNFSKAITEKKKTPVAAVIKSDDYPESVFLAELDFAKTFNIIFEKVPITRVGDISKENIFQFMGRLLGDGRICAILPRTKEYYNFFSLASDIGVKTYKDISAFPNSSIFFDWYLNTDSKIFTPEITAIGEIIDSLIPDLKNMTILALEDNSPKYSSFSFGLLFSVYLAKKYKGDYSLSLSRTEEHFNSNLKQADIIILNNGPKPDFFLMKEKAVLISTTDCDLTLPRDKNLNFINYSDYRTILQLSIFKNIYEAFKLN